MLASVEWGLELRAGGCPVGHNRDLDLGAIVLASAWNRVWKATSQPWCGAGFGTRLELGLEEGLEQTGHESKQKHKAT